MKNKTLELIYIFIKTLDFRLKEEFLKTKHRL